MGSDVTCKECGFKRGFPNQWKNGKLINEFVCSDCKNGYDNTDEKVEFKYFNGGVK